MHNKAQGMFTLKLFTKYILSLNIGSVGCKTMLKIKTEISMIFLEIQVWPSHTDSTGHKDINYIHFQASRLKTGIDFFFEEDNSACLTFLAFLVLTCEPNNPKTSTWSIVSVFHFISE